ncbi:unnamed protein product [Aphanomyces euteiches]
MMRMWSSFKYTITGRSSRPSDVSSRSDSSVKTEKTASKTALGRIVSNVVAGMLVFLPIFTLIVLVTQDMFDRLVVSVNTQTTTFYWSDYGKSCVLSATGWTPSTCDAATKAVTPDKTFAAIGVVLSQQWSKEIAEAGGALQVTTCVIGGTSDVGWANMQFIAGYDYFPACLPTAPQDIAGVAMLETTIRDDHVDGLFFLTLYSDLDPSMTVYSYGNSDGTFQNLMANPQRTLITADGNIEKDTVGGDYIIYSRPLGARYLVMGYCLTEIEELSQVVIDQGLTGWSQGKHSKHPVVPGWACGHKVSNAQELIDLQIVFAFGTLICFVGFGGVLQGKPVLTYTILSGLERRKLLVAFVVLNAMPGLLYADVARIYYFTQNGFKIWCLSCIMVANFFSFGLVFVVSVLDMIPLQLGHVVSYSAPVSSTHRLPPSQLLAAPTLSTNTPKTCFTQRLHISVNLFDTLSPQFLVALHVNDADWPSGSYTSAGTPAALTYLASSITLPLLIAFLCSIVLAMIYRCIVHQRQ